jgi:magnesium-transporting ATPase (P-type)
MQLNSFIQWGLNIRGSSTAAYRILTLIILTGIAIMAYFLFLAIEYGNLAQEGKLLLKMPWGMLSLIDIYTGLLLFSYWIIWREKHLLVSLPWVALLLILGNMGTCLYLLKCLSESKDSPAIFLMGKKVK